jgi:hypothetical protein
MATHLDRATFGEQGFGFFLGAQGYFLVDGPSGTQGHAANASGFDGVAYNIALDDLIIYDNKAFKAEGNVSKGTAIDPAANLTKNIDALIARVQNMQDLPSRTRIAGLLQQTRNAISGTGITPPANVRIAISNYGGNSTGVTYSFAGRGITFIDAKNAPAVPVLAARTYVNPQTLKLLTRPIMPELRFMQARAARGAAVADLVRVGFQVLNDFSLKSAVEREKERLAPQIHAALARGNGVLIVIYVNAMSPPGNVGMVVARSVSSASVFEFAGSRSSDAMAAWERRPRLEWGRPLHVLLETQFFWIPPTASGLPEKKTKKAESGPVLQHPLR